MFQGVKLMRGLRVGGGGGEGEENQRDKDFVVFMSSLGACSFTSL